MSQAAYGQLESPVGDASPTDALTDALFHQGGLHNHASARGHSRDPSWQERVGRVDHGDETISLGRMQIDDEAQAQQKAVKQKEKEKEKARRSSMKAEEHKGKEGVPNVATAASTQKQQQLTVPATSSSQPQQQKSKTVQWEPVSPGILDRSPEVVATQRKNEYYAAPSSSRYFWPSGEEAMKAKKEQASKALELAYPLQGLEGGLLHITTQEFRNLLISALKSDDLSTIRSLLTSPLPQSVGMLKCCIKRHKSGLLSSFFPSYECFLEEAEGPVFMMSSKKRSHNKTSNYTISLLTMDALEKSKATENAASMASENPYYLGKLRSNFSGSEFVGYDAGINPKTLLAQSGSSSSRRPSESKLANVRQELCTITFENNLLSRSPRKFTCVIPGMLKEDASKRIICKPLVPSDTLKYQYTQFQQTQAEKNPKLHEEQLNYQEIMILSNKEPVFEQSIQAFCLNFNGRATIASVKNFQLISQRGELEKNPVMLQFGKVDKDIFTMDARYPMSLLQAFEISLAGLDTKLICD